MDIATRVITVILEPAEEGGYVVTSPDLPGLVTEGDTWEEAKDMAQDAVYGYLEALAKDGVSIPRNPDIRYVLKGESHELAL